MCGGGNAAYSDPRFDILSKHLEYILLIEDRHGRKSTIIASQLPVGSWYEVLAKNATIADAILDRMVKTSYHFELKGNSQRK